MTTGEKIFIGIFTVLPVSYLVPLISFVVFQISFSETNSVDLPGPPLVLGFLLTVLLQLSLLIFYLADLFTSRKVPKTRRILWAIVLFLGNIFAFPVYWYLYIWKNQNQSLTT